MSLVAVASGTLLAIGSLFCLIGAIGLLRLPDFFARTHATTITDTVGAGFLLAGMAVLAGLSLVSVKLLLIFILLLFTSPTAAHALAQAALADHVTPWQHDRSAPGRKRKRG